MTDIPRDQPKQITEIAAGSAPQDPVQPVTSTGQRARTPLSFFALRQDLAGWQSIIAGLLCIAACLGIWWWLTTGEPDERIMSPAVLPSPAKTFSQESIRTLWFERALTRNTLASLRRVVLGFSLAALVGVPLGVLCGCFSWLNAFFAPLMIFGRNIPIAALIPLTYSFFGIGEFQKVMFIFIACVAFIVFDTARALRDISSKYVDTALTLGATRLQVISKVLVPLSLPSVFNSLRLLFGLAFGYIMLVELVTIGGEGGLGHIINVSQRLGPFTHILLILMLIPLVALAIDRFLFWMQRELFPFQYGGAGILHGGVRWTMRGWEGMTSIVRRPTPYTLSEIEKKS